MNRTCFFLTGLLLTLNLWSQTNERPCSHAACFNRSPLADSIDVLHYAIHLTEVDFQAQEIAAHTQVKLRSKIDGLNVIPLELISLTVDSVLQLENMQNLAYVQSSNRMSIEPNMPLSLDDTLELIVYYHGAPFHEDWGGFHFSGNYAFNLGVGFQSDPHNLGKAWFPCVDDFTDRAYYDVYIHTHSDQKGISGGELISSTLLEDEIVWHWQLQQNIPTYLASIAIGDYVAYQDTLAGKSGLHPLFIYTRPSEADKVEGSFSRLPQIFSLFDSLFLDYPWSRVGYVGTAIGAMEHATNIAYPHFTINGNTTYESLLTHELSHMWFGDLVTCASAEDMWLNEGWATFCQMYYRYHLFGEENYRNAMRAHHKDVLQNTHITDGGYLALYGIPGEYTYGSTVYDKGACVTHSLMNYLGPDVFFPAVSAYLEAFSFQHASSFDLRDFLTSHTGTDMTAFFDAWVFSPGTPHFTIDSSMVKPASGKYEIQLFFQQKYKGFDYLALDNIVEVGCVDDKWDIHTDTLHFSGKNGSGTIYMDFDPLQIWMDPHEKLADATTDQYFRIYETGEHPFNLGYFSLFVENLTDSALFRLTHHWVPPDPLKHPVEGLTLSDYRHWSVEGIWKETDTLRGRFFYSNSGNLDDSFLTNPADSLMLMYRPDARYDWQPVDYERLGPWNIGYLFVEPLLAGDYTLATLDMTVGMDEKSPDEANSSLLDAYPNPTKEKLMIKTYNEGDAVLQIYNTSGLRVFEKKLRRASKTRVETSGWKSGMYVITLISDDKKQYARKRIIIG